MKQRHNRNSSSKFGKPKLTPTKLRIVSGSHRGRKVSYNGDPATRPMKEKTREAVFSLLGGKFKNQTVIDLFGGTGILAIETLSRGAEYGLVMELSRRAVTTIIENLNVLEMNDRVQVMNVDSVRWLRDIEANLKEGRLPSWLDQPWIVFVCPPYRLWTSEQENLVRAIETMHRIAPEGSSIVCETDHTFQIQDVLTELTWDVRKYPPATIAITRT